MPLADTGIASAQAVERTLATPETDAAQQPDHSQEETSAGAPEETPAQPEGEATTPVPEAEVTAPKPEQPAKPATPAKPKSARAAVASNALSCVAGNIYSVSSNGQLQQIVVSGATGTVTNEGTRASSVSSFNGLGIGDQGRAVYAYERSSSSNNTVYRYDIDTKTWRTAYARGFSASAANVTSLVGGAVDPQGRYWAGGFNSDGNFQLWATNAAGTAMEQRGAVDLLNRGWNTSNGNGDMAFDTLGNLYVVRGNNSSTALDVFRVDAANLASSSGTRAVRVTAKENTSSSPFAGVNGIAYDAQGKLYVGGSSGGSSSIGYMDLPLAANAKPQSVRLTGTLSTTDLATCSFPPTVKIQKDLPDGRAFANDQFKLQLKSGNTVLGEATTTGNDSGIQDEKVGPVPVAIGASMSFTEVAGNSSTDLKNYVTSWECLLDGRVLWSDKSLGTSFTMPAEAAGKEILCTIKNSLMDVSKTAIGADGKDLPSGTPVDENGVVGYKLTFDNRAGTNPAVVNYRDYLADVLDDATFYNPTSQQRTTSPVITLSGTGLTHAWSAADKWLTIGGTVPAKQMLTLTMYVKVKENADATAERQAATSPQGFFLRNKLARGTDPKPPTDCVPGLCVENPINAWTVAKSSLPASGARLHKGGNAHYKITATKLTGTTTLNDLVLTDDVTHVFKTAGWAPDAAVPSGAKKHGVYLFNADGRTIGLNGQPNTSSADTYAPVQDVAAPKQVDGRWIVTSGPALKVPAQAVSAEMWFAVQAAESPAGIPDPKIWQGAGNAPTTGWTFVNYATGIAKGSQGNVFAPNVCVTGKNVPDTALDPKSTTPADAQFPAQCQVRHELSQNYFTIRKDAGGAGLERYADDVIPGTTEKWDPDSTGLWNMVGHKFEVRNDVAGKPSAYPAVELCRTDYAADGWNGAWVSSTRAADAGAWDFGQNSKTLQKLIDWNTMNPDNQKPLCGTIYPIADGGQAGRWRSENLSAGNFWLVETQAPNQQRSTDGKHVRDVTGVQRLSQPMQFTIWPEADGPANGQSMQGRGQLDVSNGKGGVLDRCNPGETNPETGEITKGGTVAERPTACVNPTGYLMLVKDPAPVPLPMTGGQWLPIVLGGGVAALIAALAGAVWWRRRADREPARAGRHAA
ncbi:DUF7927 domain-containing protein [Leucobacter aridicollis]|uniref:DUF7927 domain-containing protein n=1 Tax=Leucobacter aridicollis TaxID=283878 RepID=UPI0021047652|nr:hypothetical protein [Leucobacter aridicollis]UTX53477.1 hypothetical protein KI794_01580 [Leucobacter aridicollis]